MDIVFETASNKIRLPITEVLLCAAASNPARKKKQQYWTPRNAVLLPPLLTEAAILNGESDVRDILKIFACSITERAEEVEYAGGDNNNDDNGDNESECGVEAKEKNTTETGKTKQATTKRLSTIAENCDDVLDFLQAVTVKSPRVTAAPLSLQTDKRVYVWFCNWTGTNLPNPPKPSKPASQDHMGITGVLANMVTRLQTAEALLPVVADQNKAEKKTKGWYRLPPTSQCVILAAIATKGTSIPNLPPSTLHRFLNARSATTLQANCALTYSGNNLYLPTSFCQALLQRNILAIPDPDSPTVLSPLPIPPYSSGPANAQ